MLANRSNRTSSNTRKARSIHFLVADPDKVLYKESISASKAMSVAVKRRTKPCLDWAWHFEHLPSLRYCRTKRDLLA